MPPPSHLLGTEGRRRACLANDGCRPIRVIEGPPGDDLFRFSDRSQTAALTPPAPAANPFPSRSCPAHQRMRPGFRPERALDPAARGEAQDDQRQQKKHHDHEAHAHVLRLALAGSMHPWRCLRGRALRLRLQGSGCHAQRHGLIFAARRGGWKGSHQPQGQGIESGPARKGSAHLITICSKNCQ